MTRSMTTALNAPILFREKVQAIRAKLDAGEMNPAMAMLEIGVAYLDLEQTVAWAQDKAQGDERAVVGLQKTQAKLQRLARSMVAVPDVRSD
jgi:hypothetical protein